jgi:hypothetical protein
MPIPGEGILHLPAQLTKLGDFAGQMPVELITGSD